MKKGFIKREQGVLVVITQHKQSMMKMAIVNCRLNLIETPDKLTLKKDY
jgi:hypothetical protein